METISIHLQTFFEWLLRSSLQASLLICLILLIQSVLRGRLGVRWHYALWFLLLVRMIMPWSPQSRLSMYNFIPQHKTEQLAQVTQIRSNDESFFTDYLATDSESTSVNTATESLLPESENEIGEMPLVAPETGDNVTTRTAAIQEANENIDMAKIARVLSFIWLAGALVLAVYIGAGNFNLWRIVKHQHPLTNQKILDLLEECKDQMGVQTILGIVPTDKVNSPALFGFIRPRLLLPQVMLENLSSEELRYILLHELAHLKRRDIYIGWLTSLLQILHWFNPLVWFAFYHMWTDRELACDALVLTRTQSGKAKDYGSVIVSLVERFSKSKRLPAIAGIIESKSQLKRRITMIAEYHKKSYQWSPLAILLIIVLGSVSLPNAISTKASQSSDAESAPPISLRRIWADSDVDVEGEVSPDGKYISYVDWETGDLAVYEVATGKKRRLTNKGTWDESDEYAEFSRWSPDSKQIVYDWYNKDYIIELRIVGLDGTEPRILFSNKEVTWAQTYDWSPDGKQILACFSRKDGQEQIVLVSVADGSERILKTLDNDYPQNMVFSPDGRYIVYDFPQKESSLESDIFLLLADGSREIPLIEHPADDRVLGWTPDGKNILFTSERTGNPCMLSVAIADGIVQGIPKLIRKDIGQKFTSMGFTKEGSFYYGCGGGGGFDVYTARLDLQTGKVLSPPKKAIQRFEGHNATPDYSPDGKYLAYVSHRGSRHQILCIRSLETGQEQEFPSKLMGITGPKWSPDGNSILIAGMDYNSNRYGNYQVDPKTGIFTPVMLPSKDFRFGSHEWSRDGKSFFHGRSSVEDKYSQIMLRDVKSGEEKEIYRTAGLEQFRLACSPDGKWLAFINLRNNRAIRIIPSAGGEPGDLYKCEPQKEQLMALKWTPDGKYILFVKREIEQKESNLWKIPVEGGEPQKIDLGINIGGMTIHPDGQQITFGTRENQPAEIWVMENFLPETLTVKASEAISSQASNQAKFTKIQIPNRIPQDTRLSPDGKSIVFVNDDRIWIMPISSSLGLGYPGEPRLLDTGGVLVDRTDLTWSNDGKWIAFTGNESENGNQKIYVVSANGGEPRLVHENNRHSIVLNYRMSLSPDGKTLAFSTFDGHGIYIETISTEGGSPRRLVETPAREPVFSPDGNTIAYVESKNLSAGGGALWTIPASGGTPVLVADANNASSPVWSPEGRMIAFIDYGADFQIYLVPVTKDGRPVGKKFKLELPEGTEGATRLAGWTPNNKIGALYTKKEEYALYTRRIEGGKASFITVGGYPMQPRWSPDGKLIYHTNNPDDTSGDWERYAIAYVPAEGGDVTTVPIKSEDNITIWGYGAGNRVSPDGKTIVFAGQTVQEENLNRLNIWTISTEGGEPERLTNPPDGFTDWYPSWSHDGQEIVFVRQKLSEDSSTPEEGSIYVVSTKGGEPVRITWDSDRVYSAGPVLWSPDGKLLAFYSRDKDKIDGALCVIRPNGGELKVVANVSSIYANKELAWSPDSKRIAFQGVGGIKIVSLEDGSLREIKVDLVGTKIYHLDWSPDGESLAFAGYTGGGTEFWVMENFLP